MLGLRRCCGHHHDPSDRARARHHADDDDVDPADIVEQVVIARFESFRACSADLDACDLDEATRFNGLEREVSRRNQLAGFIETGQIVIDNENQDTFVIGIEEITDDRTEAIVVSCEYNGSVLVQPATETEPEQILNAGNTTKRVRQLVRRIEGEWLVTARETAEEVTGRDESICT